MRLRPLKCRRHSSEYPNLSLFAKRHNTDYDRLCIAVLFMLPVYHSILATIKVYSTLKACIFIDNIKGE